MPDFMNPERDKAISFSVAPDGTAGFAVLHLLAPQEIDGLEAARWRKVFRSPTFPDRHAAFDAARQQFAWVREAWRAELVNLAPPANPR
ncbi:MAG: hypothetical protein ACTHLU_11490 [Novosphingobium sp.]